ncbi:DUF6671 family protein [Pseudoalteromonas sp. US3C1013]|jgi:hypothetical protein|uniref:DUF6671 family protein n=1 Tax=unclassified Pseudoalteromonas TaxID=194690 RepID=UPI003AB3ACC4
MLNAVIATKHKKAPLIAPALKPLGYNVVTTSLFDTDTLGMFTNEVQRDCSAQIAALTKAQRACELTGEQFGLGSEGSFGGGPYPGLMNWDEEVICFYDKHTDIAIYGHAGGPFSPSSLTINSETNVESIIAACQRYKEQHWILDDTQTLYKGLSFEGLVALFKEKAPKAGIITPDLRAMYSGQRQAIICLAAEDLARRLASKCPQCQRANFVAKQLTKGLLCELCNMPTQQVKSTTSLCDCCGYNHIEANEKHVADATYCQFCNP